MAGEPLFLFANAFQAKASWRSLPLPWWSSGPASSCTSPRPGSLALRPGSSNGFSRGSPGTEPGTESSPDELIAAAMAVRAMAAWDDFRRFQPLHGGEHDHSLALSIDRLAEAVLRSKLSGRLNDADAEVIRWQLQDRAALRPILAALSDDPQEPRTARDAA
jgi:hypothetical protein